MPGNALSDKAITLEELGKDPFKALASIGERPAAIMDGGKVSHYIFRAEVYENLMMKAGAWLLANGAPK